MSKTIIIGSNQNGEPRYIEIARAPGVTGTGITADKAKATVFDSWDEARTALRALLAWDTWPTRIYAWRIQDAIIRPADDEFYSLEGWSAREDAGGFFKLIDGTLFVIPMDANGCKDACDPIEVDFAGIDADDAVKCRAIEAELKAKIKEVSCAKCAKRIARGAAFTDEDEDGKTWLYCSQDCLERH